MDHPTFEGFEVSIDGTRGDIVLNRPDRLNSLTTQTLFDLESAARWFDTQSEVRVVVVRGEGRAFSSGADLSSFSDEGRGPYSAHDAGDAGRRMADAIEAMGAIAIAQIHGHCVGGGLVLAAACDLRYAAATTSFSIPEIDLGIPLAWGGIPRLVREIGPALTKELVMTCRRFGADEALQAGFLNAAVDPDALAGVVDQVATTIARKPRYAIRTTKVATNAVTASMVGTVGAWSDADALAAGLHDPEGQAAAAAYLQSVRGGS